MLSRVKRYIRRYLIERVELQQSAHKNNILRSRATINGRSFEVPRCIDFLGEASVVTELWMVDVLSRLLSADGVFVDIGVNRAQTLLKAKAVAPECRYIGIEPMPESVAFANEVVRMNKLTACSLICAAVGDSHFQLLPLTMRRGRTLDSKAALSFDTDLQSYGDRMHGGREQRLTFCARFDVIHSGLGTPAVDMIKIDVEGAERRVLEGMSDLLKDSRPFVLIEILPPRSERAHKEIEDQLSIQELLQRHDYRLLRIRKAEGMRRCAGLEELKTWPFVYAGSSKRYRDYIAIPREQLPMVQDWMVYEEGLRPGKTEAVTD